MVQIKGVIGSPVVCFKYRDGVIVGTDSAGSSGSLTIPEVLRMYQLTENCIVAFSGKMSDVQFLYKTIKSFVLNDERPITPEGVHRRIQAVIYERRSRLELLHVSVVVCGVQDEGQVGQEFSCVDSSGRFVGVVNSKGSFWFDDMVATGLASHLILPILREKNTLEMGREEAVQQMEECMKILHYKGCQFTGVIQIGICEKGVMEIKEPYRVATDWSIGIKQNETVL